MAIRNVVPGLVLGLCSLTAVAQPDSIETAGLPPFLEQLSKVQAMGEACNEHMNYYGARALEGAVCKEFKAEFYQHWQSPQALTAEWDAFNQQINSVPGGDSTQRAMILKADEMRVKIVYFLDYMEFVKGM